MAKLHVGDTVMFKQGKEGLVGQEFTVSHVRTFPNESVDEITLEECPYYAFDANLFEIVRECPHKEGDKFRLKSVFWNIEQKKFIIDSVTGTYKDGCIEFDKRTMDCYHVPLTKLGKFYDRETNGNDFDVVFCRSTDEDIKKAKQVWLNVLNERIRELEKDLSELVINRTALEDLLLEES